MREIIENPFYVLDLAVTCTAMEVETQGQKLQAMLGLDLDAAKTYRSPLGIHPRDAENVRAAMAQLRDPNQRLKFEFFVHPDEGSAALTSDPKKLPPAPSFDPAGPWPDAFSAFGWKRP